MLCRGDLRLGDIIVKTYSPNSLSMGFCYAFRKKLVMFRSDFPFSMTTIIVLLYV